MTNLTDEGLMDEIEQLSSEIHKCYCRAYERRFGKPYWTGGDYSKLDEPTKDYDREMARFMLQQLQQVRDAAKKETVERCAAYLDSLVRDYYNEDLFPSIPDAERAIGGKAADVLRRSLPGYATAIRQMDGGK